VITKEPSKIAAALFIERAKPDAQIRVVTLVKTLRVWAPDFIKIRRPRRGASNHIARDC